MHDGHLILRQIESEPPFDPSVKLLRIHHFVPRCKLIFEYLCVAHGALSIKLQAQCVQHCLPLSPLQSARRLFRRGAARKREEAQKPREGDAWPRPAREMLGHLFGFVGGGVVVAAG